MYKQIVVGTDGSTGANVAVDTALELARLTGATLHIVHAHRLSSAFGMAAAAEIGVVPNVVESNEAILEESKKICDVAVANVVGLGVQAEGHSEAGDAADALTRVATDTKADLIVVGNRGMSGTRRSCSAACPTRCRTTARRACSSSTLRTAEPAGSDRVNSW